MATGTSTQVGARIALGRQAAGVVAGGVAAAIGAAIAGIGAFVCHHATGPCLQV